MSPRSADLWPTKESSLAERLFVMIQFRRSRGADLDAIEALYRARLGDFLRMAQGLVGDADTARDIVHDAFVSAVRKRRSYRGDGTLEGWIWRSVVNRHAITIAGRR
jgi:DNA-directed RNA polymerase specialized sigma24 family protein